VQRSGVGHRALQGTCEPRWPLEAVGTGPEPDRLDAVLALIVNDLARIWTKQRRKRGPTLATPTLPRGLHPTSETSKWKP